MATSKRAPSSTGTAATAAANVPDAVATAPAINLQRVVKSVDPLGQAGADTPVIDVAAGRPAGVVEPLGDYHMDPHDVPALQSACRTPPASRWAELNHIGR